MTVILCVSALQPQDEPSPPVQTSSEAKVRDKSRCLKLGMKARKLVEALGVAWNCDKWVHVVQRVLQQRALANQESSQKSLDNRVPWARFLAHLDQLQDADKHRWVTPVVRFYLSFMDGSGDVERSLGKHAAFLNAHVGAAEGDEVSMTEVCLEVASEGPAKEEEMFTQTSGGALLLTDFTRQCATLWLTLQGRRFGCYKKRQDSGKVRTGWRLPGSFKATQILQHAAHDRLVRDAASPSGSDGTRKTIVGLSRSQVKSMVDDARKAPDAVVSRSLLNFRKTTTDRLEKKTFLDEAGNPKVWPGYGPGPPKLRPRKGLAKTSASSAAVSVATVAAKWISLNHKRTVAKQKAQAQAVRPPLVVIDDSGEGSDVAKRSSKYKDNLNLAKIALAESVVVWSQDDLTKAREPSSSMLQAWLGIIALGLKVYEQGSKIGPHTGRRYGKSVSQVPARVRFTTRFQERHRHLVQSFQEVFKKPGARWSQVASIADDSKRSKIAVQTIDGLSDVQHFLLGKRRLGQAGRVAGGSYESVPHKKAAKLSRYGHVTGRGCSSQAW